MDRDDLVNAQQWVDYTVTNWWMPAGVVQPIMIGGHVEEILFVLDNAWDNRDIARAWGEIERINDNYIDMSQMESSIAFLRCGHIILEMENMEGAENNFKNALVRMPRSMAHHVAVISWLLGVVYWVRPGKHPDAINLWQDAVSTFTQLWRNGATGMRAKDWYNRQLQIMRRVLRLAIREDRLPPLDSIPGASPPSQTALLFAAAEDGPFAAGQDDSEEDSDLIVAVEGRDSEDLSGVDGEEEDLSESASFDLDFIPSRLDEEDSEQIEIVKDLFPHDSAVVHDFLRILAVYEEVAAGPEAVVRPTPLNPVGVDGLDIDAYIEVTQVRIGDQLYYVNSLKNGSNTGSQSIGELNVNLIHEFEHFILRVKGDSMNQAGVDDGDYVIVRAQPQGSSGDIVVAQIKEEESKATLKRFKAETTNEIFLRPETDNPAIDPDGFTFTKKDVNDSDKVMILGVALAVLKPVR